MNHEYERPIPIPHASIATSNNKELRGLSNGDVVAISLLEVTGSFFKPQGRVIEHVNSLVGRELHIAKLYIKNRDKRIKLSMGLPILSVSSGIAGVVCRTGVSHSFFFHRQDVIYSSSSKPVSHSSRHRIFKGSHVQMIMFASLLSLSHSGTCLISSGNLI